MGELVVAWLDEQEVAWTDELLDEVLAVLSVA